MPDPQPAASFGAHAAADLIHCKAQGQTFTRSQLADRIDVLLEEWQQRQSAQILTLQAECPRNQIPPTAEAVSTHSQSIGYPINGPEWCDHYAAKGWIVGRTRMKDWQAAVRNWKTNGWGLKTSMTRTSSAAGTSNARDYSRI